MKSNKIRFMKAALTVLPALALLMIAIALYSSPTGAAQSREVRVVNNTALAGQNVNVALELVSLGNENALGFSLNFNPAIFGNPVGALGTGGTGATLNVNPAQAASGRIGVTLALAAGQSFAAGTRQIVVVTLAVAGNAAAGATSISFGDQPVFREISDPNANPVTATFTPGTITIQQPNPVPALTSLLPSSGPAGSGGFPLTVNGSNFVNGSTVQWNGSARTTAFVSSTQLTAIIPPSDLASAGTATVTVVNAAPGGGTSNGLTFTINNPAPAITSLSPNAATAGGATFTLTINGSGFVSTSSVWWNGAARVTTFVNTTQLTAAIPASDIATAGTATVVVMNPSPGGGSSPAATFTVNNPSPTLTSVNPSSATAGVAAFTLTVNGTGFVNGSSVRWNGGARTTAFVSATQLTATIPATDIATAGTATVTVVNPAPAGGTSNSLSFTINNPSPTLTSVNPASATAGVAAFTLTVNGSGFVNGAAVRWNGGARTTMFVSATQLTAQIPAADIAAAGSADVTVANPAPGGGTSNTVAFAILNPVPAITSLSPSSTPAGGPSFTLTVNGNGFVTGAMARFNGMARMTTVVSSTQVNAQIGGADVQTAGTASVTVVNPPTGGGESNALTFTVTQAPTAQIVIDPASPTVNDNITIRLSGTWPDGCVPQNPQLTVTGNDLRIDTSNPGQVCATVLTDWSLNVSAGRLAAGNYTVRVIHTASSVQRQLGQRTFTVNNLAPTIAGVSPGAAAAGGAAFTLTVNGTNFVNGATVRWNGGARTTSFVNVTTLTAQIPATDIAAAGTASITVVTPAPGGGTSNALQFTINGTLASVSAASFLGAELASESIVAAFGVNLATSVQIANSVPLPTMLAGTKVSVKDSAGVERLSPLFFVAPTQVNYQIPPGTASGAATITITSGDGKISAGVQQIASVAPGLFTANANGLGVPAATIFRLRANGTTADEPIAQFDSTLMRFVPLPIDLGPEGDQVFAVLFGTGFRNNTGLPSVSVKIGGTDVEVLYAGVAPGFVGLDQSNARIPRSLIGRGEVDLVMTVNGKVANTVRISIK